MGLGLGLASQAGVRVRVRGRRTSAELEPEAMLNLSRVAPAGDEAFELSKELCHVLDWLRGVPLDPPVFDENQTPSTTPKLIRLGTSCLELSSQVLLTEEEEVLCV